VKGVVAVRTVAGLWRWRGNALCRRTDRREAWLALCAALLIVLGAPSVALAVRAVAHAELTDAVRQQHQLRHPVRATVQQVLRDVPETEVDRPGSSTHLHQVVATWRTPAGLRRTGTVGTDRRVVPGDSFRIWTDRRGRVTSPPMTVAGASSHAAVAGLVTGVVTGFLVEALRRCALRQLLRRRYARWEEEWARIGPDWGRAGTTS
jgi:hypothetical protein